MNTRSGLCMRARWMLLAVAGAAACAAAQGAGKSAAADARAVYERELASCQSKPSNDDRATCRREADAAHAEARRGGSTVDPAQLAANALKRCDALPETDHKDCIARMQGRGTTRGSVAEGGIYRELVTRESGTPAAVPASAAK